VRHRTAVSQRVLDNHRAGIMSMLSAGSRCLRRSINSTAAADGQLYKADRQQERCPKIRSRARHRTDRSPQQQGRLASGHVFDDGPARPANAIALTQPRCVLFRSKNSKKKATANICRFSKTRNNHPPKTNCPDLRLAASSASGEVTQGRVLLICSCPCGRARSFYAASFCLRER